MQAHWDELLVRFLVVWARVADTRRALAAQSTVEYALVGALVVIAAATALTVLGEQVTTVFTNIGNTLRISHDAAPR